MSSVGASTVAADIANRQPPTANRQPQRPGRRRPKAHPALTRRQEPRVPPRYPSPAALARPRPACPAGTGALERGGARGAGRWAAAARGRARSGGPPSGSSPPSPPCSPGSTTAPAAGASPCSGSGCPRSPGPWGCSSGRTPGSTSAPSSLTLLLTALGLLAGGMSAVGPVASGAGTQLLVAAAIGAGMPLAGTGMGAGARLPRRRRLAARAAAGAAHTRGPHRR